MPLSSVYTNLLACVPSQYSNYFFTIKAFCPKYFDAKFAVTCIKNILRTITQPPVYQNDVIKTYYYNE